MKKTVVSMFLLFLSACSNEQICYREDCFISETCTTEDMQKIHDILVKYYRTTLNAKSEVRLKTVKVICELYGKNNKQLNKEIDKIEKVYESREKNKENEKLLSDLEKSLKGFRLDFKQLILLVKGLEKDYREIERKNKKLLEPYKVRATEILKLIDEEKQKEDILSWGHYEDGLRWETKLGVYHSIKYVAYNDYNKFSTYSFMFDLLTRLIDDGILVDSFLEKHHSILLPKDEPNSGLYWYLFALVPPLEKGEIIFDSVQKAVSNNQLKKEELSKLVRDASSYLTRVISDVASVQHDVTDEIDNDTQLNLRREKDLSNFHYERYAITNLADKYPKFEDFNREIEKIADRLAYKTYYRVNIARFLYREWRNIYYSQINELLVNADKLADRLYELIKDEKISNNTSEKRRYEYRNIRRSISDIKEISKIGMKKILSSPDCYIDSRSEIKKAFKRKFIKIREAYLKNIAG